MSKAVSALMGIDPRVWEVACAREPTIRRLVSLPFVSAEAIGSACRELGLARSRLFELIRRYRNNPVTSSLVDRPDGFPTGRSRLKPQIDEIVTAAIETFFLTRPKPSVAQLYREIRTTCIEAGLKPPALLSVQRRVKKVDQKRLIASRDGAKAAADKFRPVRKSYTADYPLEIVQMDHAMVDLIVVDEAYRKPIGRPVLTLQIDIATRAIPGFYISLESPSATSVGMAIRHAVLPKEEWLEQRGVAVSYPMSGIPDALHLDNAKEFHSQALTRGCQQHGIQLIYRPIRTPHYGGHIERLIGTMIGQVHLLPGTTFSNIVDKGDYDAEGQACMTLQEFERWFCLQVSIYHNSIHRTLGVTPLTAWLNQRTARPLPLRLPYDQEGFLLDFLPFELRSARREGIQLFHSHYWHGALAALAAACTDKLRVKYNPLNLSAIYLELPDGTHLTIPYRDHRKPAISKFEHDLAVRKLREEGAWAVDEQAVFAMIKEQRRIVGEAMMKTKAARRSAQRIVYALHPAGSSPPPLSIKQHPGLIEDIVPSDADEPVLPFAIEEKP